ncbi:uncharacterized protein LOC114244872 [Bombyx mandarina]|uniref:Uncharacterized protein LOC114244872 n=1 Tax=Bombyx mandarina TaxID=7092 RepID=A0A6J2JSR8_BOMMA|nr:uncharacterized protein LOC114244872 [Bombyx mandarina]
MKLLIFYLICLVCFTSAWRVFPLPSESDASGSQWVNPTPVFKPFSSSTVPRVFPPYVFPPLLVSTGLPIRPTSVWKAYTMTTEEVNYPYSTKTVQDEYQAFDA